MNKIDYYKRYIEQHKHNIERYKREIKKLREKKKEKRKYFSEYIKKATSPSSKKSRREQKIRVLASIDRDINNKLTLIEREKEKIRDIREKIKNERKRK